MKEISTVIVSLLGSIAVALISVQVQLREVKINADKFCLEHISSLVDSRILSFESLPNVLIPMYAKRCELSESQARDLLFAIKVSAEAATQPLTEDRGVSDTGLSGFVTIGAANPTTYSSVNFSVPGTDDPAIREGDAPDSGTLLEARWPVNLRENTELTTSGLNPIISVLSEGQCVKMENDAVSLRGQYWAKVSLVDCPAT